MIPGTTPLDAVPVKPPGSDAPDGTSGAPVSATARRFDARVRLTTPITARTVPRTFLEASAAPARLYATGGDPVTTAADEVRTALMACEDAREIVASSDPDLREAFDFARTQLDLAARMTADTAIPDLAGVRTLAGPLGPLLAITDTPRLPTPLTESHEELYGLRATLRGALGYLTEAVRALGQLPRRSAPAAAALPVLAQVCAGANRLARIADVVVAHTVFTTRPTPPELPGVGGDVELYANGRAAPYRAAALRARVRFTPGRVEITTATGKVSIGQAHAISTLLWVAPGTESALEQVMDPSERSSPQPEADGLGTVHVLDASGRSLAALEVTDWASQPTTVVDQALVDTTAGDIPLGAARGLYALEALGFSRGAATIGVPLRRGLAHPPAADDSVGLLRPAPHRLPYRGRDATPIRFARRRAARLRFWNSDLGPGWSFSWWSRGLLPWMVAIAPLVIWPGGGKHLVQISFAVVTLALLIEPFTAWAWALLRDVSFGTRVVARFRAPGGPFAPRMELRGRDFIMTSRSGHRTRLPGPSDGDLGVVRILRLRWAGAVWGFALADSRWRWRAVLPAAEWTPDPRAQDLENFARVTGLAIADQEVAPLPRLGQETAAPGTAAASRSFGPPARGLTVLGLLVLPVAALSLAFGPARSLWLSVIELTATLGVAGVSTLLARARLRRQPVA